MRTRRFGLSLLEAMVLVAIVAIALAIGIGVRAFYREGTGLG